MAMVCLPSTSRVVHQNKTVIGRFFYQRWRQRQPNLHHPKPPGADCVSQFGLVSLWRACSRRPNRDLVAPAHNPQITFWAVLLSAVAGASHLSSFLR